MHQSDLIYLTIDINFISLISAFDVTSSTMKRKNRKVCPININRKIRELKNGDQLFLFDDSLCKEIAKELKVPHKNVKKCLQEYQPYVRAEKLNLPLPVPKQDDVKTPGERSSDFEYFLFHGHSFTIF